MVNYTKICPVCNTEFGHGRRKSYVEKRTYCSAKCRASVLITSNPDNRSTFTCKECGKQFEDWTYRQTVFCSRVCGNRYKSKQPKPYQRRPENFVTLNCKQCGDEYTVHKSQTEGRVSNFCCRSCLDQWISENQIGANHPNYKGGTLYYDRGRNWGKQRRAAYLRDGATCQICGYKHKKKRDLDVHHIIPYKDFEGDYLKANELTNLITLCRHCHTQVEDYGLPCPKRLF